MVLEVLRTYPDLLNTIGVIGFLTYITGFQLVQTGHMCGNGIPYALTNVMAASLVLVSLIAAFNLASFLIQVSFIAIGLYGVARKLLEAPQEEPVEVQRSREMF